MKNKISIILPTYNVQKYLPECLNSILSQTLTDIEIICINDGSTDNSLDILKEYETKDHRIIIIDQKNSGSGIARNNGLKIATGEYISFLDPDDYFYNDNILLSMYKNAKNNNVNLCGGNFQMIYDIFEGCEENDKKILNEEKKYKDTTNFCFKESKLGKSEDYKSSSWFWRFIFKREFLIKNDITFPNYKRFQDIPFFSKALALSNNIFFLNENYYCYRVNHKVMKYTKEQKEHILLSLNDCFNINYKYKKYIQYSDIFTIFIEMLDVFSNDFIENIPQYADLIDFTNEIFEKIDFELFDFSWFPKKNVKNLEKIFKDKNYSKLLSLNNSSIYYQ